MSVYTTQEAGLRLCPNSNQFGTRMMQAECRGETCMAWRWVDQPASILAPHVQKAIADALSDGLKLSHKEAVAWVMENRETLGIPTGPTHGYCGLGGKP